MPAGINTDEDTFERQIASRRHPRQPAKLTPPSRGNSGMERPVRRRPSASNARLMESYSGFLDHTDEQVGRLIAAIEKRPTNSTTRLVFYIVGDNGASAEGGLEGTVNELASLNGIQPEARGLRRPSSTRSAARRTEPHVPVGWAWAADPWFKWTKQVASHFGGTRNPTHCSRGRRRSAPGANCATQFHHIIDIVPTVLEVAGIPEPKLVYGVQQKPIEGVSMLYSFDDAAAYTAHGPVFRDARQPGHLQGRLDGHDAPWAAAMADRRRRGRFEADQWELYDLNEDFTQADNLAAQNPEKVEELQAAFLEEAKKYHVLPLDDRMSERFDASLRPNPLAGRKSFSYGRGATNVSKSATLNTHGVPFRVTAEVEADSQMARTGCSRRSAGSPRAGRSMSRTVKPTFYLQLFEVKTYRVPVVRSAAPGASPPCASSSPR